MGTAEYARQDYYPSYKIRLTFRIDEFGTITKLKPPPTKSTKFLNGVKDDRAPLEVVPDPTFPGRFLLVPKGQTKAQPSTQTARSSDGLTFDLTVVPKDLEWDQNGLRTPSTLKARIKFADMPLDPRVFRSIAVEAFIGSVNEIEFARGINGERRPANQAGGGELWSLIQDSYMDGRGNQRTNSRFQGWVDSWDVEWGDSDEPVIDLSCTDNTRLMIDQELPPNLVLDQSKKLDEAIANYLSHFPALQGLSVEYRPSGVTPPVISKIFSNTAVRNKLGPHPSRGAGAMSQNGMGKHSVFDYLGDMCRLMGHALFLDGTNLIIQVPRTITTSNVNKREDDPFQGRTLPSGTKLDYRRFIYGRNVTSFKIARNYAKHVPTNIEVVSYDTTSKSKLVARFPPTNPNDPSGHRNQLTHAKPGNAQPDQKWSVINCPGIKDKDTLLLIAQQYYENLGRHELQVEVKTRNLSSYGGDNSDPDILDMRFGDTFEIMIARDDNETNTFTKIEKTQSSQSLNAAFAKSLGFASDFADAYAKAFNDAGFVPQFKTKSIKVHCSIEDGIEIHIHGINYIEVRADKSLPNGQEVGSGTPSSTPNSPKSTSGGN